MDKHNLKRDNTRANITGVIDTTDKLKTFIDAIVRGNRPELDRNELQTVLLKTVELLKNLTDPTTTNAADIQLILNNLNTVAAANAAKKEYIVINLTPVAPTVAIANVVDLSEFILPLVTNGWLVEELTVAIISGAGSVDVTFAGAGINYTFTGAVFGIQLAKPNPDQTINGGNTVKITTSNLAGTVNGLSIGITLSKIPV